jgi:hypothetical protein
MTQSTDMQRPDRNKPKEDSSRIADEDMARQVNQQATAAVVKWVLAIMASVAGGAMLFMLTSGLKTLAEMRDDNREIKLQISQATNERTVLSNKIEKWGERFDLQQKSISESVAKIEAVTFRVGATESALTSITQQLTDVRERQLKGQETMAEIRTELTLRGALTPKK